MLPYNENAGCSSMIMIFGILMAVIGGFNTIKDGNIVEGIIIIVVGFGIAVGASFFVKIEAEATKRRRTKEEFNKWKNKIKKAGFEQKIKDSVAIAVEIYKTNPGKLTIEYISSLNPSAGELIRNMFGS